MIVKSGGNIKLESAKQVSRMLKEILNAEPELEQSKEHFWVIGLKQNMVIKFIDLCHLGGLTACLVDVRSIFRLAIYRDVSNIIIAHNHISGNIEPSKDDEKITEKIYRAGEILDIELRDSIIISEERYYSFYTKGKLNYGKENNNE